MSRVTRLVIVGCAVILAFEFVMAVLDRRFGFAMRYRNLAEFAFYVWVGFAAARASTRRPIRASAAAGAIIGMVDASAGWIFRWAMGLTKLSTGIVLPLGTLLTLGAMVVALATLLATAGGIAGRRRKE